MKYNLYIETPFNRFNIFDISEEQLAKVIDAYHRGDAELTIAGKKYVLKNLRDIQFYSIESGKISAASLLKKAIDLGEAPGNFGGGYYLSPKLLAMVGNNLTAEIIGDAGFGDKNKKLLEDKAKDILFVNEYRIAELKKTSTSQFDLIRLIRFCEEMNDNNSRGNYLSVAMIGRSIINHVPPIFGYSTFNEVANNYGGASFKKAMSHLNLTMRSIADSYLHDTIRKTETLPNSTQVNFSQDLDVLLSEVVRKLNDK